MWCSYHSSFKSAAGPSVYYFVVPDQSGECSIGCGRDSNPINNLYSVISTEVVIVCIYYVRVHMYYNKYASITAWILYCNGLDVY